MYSGGLNFALGDDLDALRETVRRFASERIAPQAADIDRSNSFSDAALAGNGPNSACSGLRPARTMVASALVISPIAL